MPAQHAAPRDEIIKWEGTSVQRSIRDIDSRVFGRDYAVLATSTCLPLTSLDAWIQHTTGMIPELVQQSDDKLTTSRNV